MTVNFTSGTTVAVYTYIIISCRPEFLNTNWFLKNDSYLAEDKKRFQSHFLIFPSYPDYLLHFLVGNQIKKWLCLNTLKIHFKIILSSFQQFFTLIKIKWHSLAFQSKDYFKMVTCLPWYFLQLFYNFGINRIIWFCLMCVNLNLWRNFSFNGR